MYSLQRPRENSGDIIPRASKSIEAFWKLPRESPLPILKFTFRRILLGVVIMFVVSLLVFVATQALPGDAAVAKLGRGATPVALAAFRAHFHLTEPVIEQYFSWLGDLLRGKLGVSLSAPVSVGTLIRQRIGNSFVLLLVAACIGIPIALALGIISARRRDSVFDHTASLTLLALAALPEFVIGIILTLLLATNVTHVFPPASLLNPQQSIWSQLRLVLLPALTLALAIIPYIARMTRGSMIEVLESDYVAMARLKGVRERRVLLRYAFPNASAPTFQAIALTLAYLIGGVVVVETVFQYPGIGLALVSAIQNRDLPVIQALVLLITLVYLAVSIGADVLTTLATPRLRTQLK
jgi:peptide/nickel transport system permease protein